jgi:Restriction endonuclease EcoRII, N-terminal
LDPQKKNPFAWIECVDENDEIHRFRYVYYNNKLHDEGGTRNEYRITHMTGYLSRIEAKAGDVLEISRSAKDNYYTLRTLQMAKATKPAPTKSIETVKLKGWNRVH